MDRERSDMDTLKLGGADGKWHGILTASSSIRGSRKTQEDAVFVSEDAVFGTGDSVATLAVLCDGIGGLAGGAHASAGCVDGMRAAFDRYCATAARSGELEAGMRRFLDSAIREVSVDIAVSARYDLSVQASGTTLVAAALANNHVYWASAGDSRAYVFRQGRMSQLTRDHSYALVLDRMAADGEITRAEALSHPNRNALISFVGMGHVPILDVCEAPCALSDGDILLLCSDGLVKALSEDDIAGIIGRHVGSLEDMAKRLPQAAKRAMRRGLDNTTVALIKYMDG